MPNSVIEFLELLKIRIDKYIEEIGNLSATTEELSRTELIYKKLEKNFALLGNDDFCIEIMNILKQYDNPAKKKFIIDNIINLTQLGKAIASGLSVELLESEKNLYNELLQAIKRVIEIQKEKKLNVEKIKINKIEEENKQLIELQDKLSRGKNGSEYFTSEEIQIINSMGIKVGFNFTLEILEYIREITEYIKENNEKKASEKMKEEKNIIELDENLVQKLFEKYGYDYVNMPKIYKKAILKTCKLNHIDDIFKIIELNKPLWFLKNVPLNESNIKVKRYYRKLFLILKYATPSTLKYIIDDATKRGINVEDILIIEGVYKHVSKEKDNSIGGDTGEESLSVSGAFEYYKETAKLLDALSNKYRAETKDNSIDLFKTTLAKAPTIFRYNSTIIKENLKLAPNYGLKLIEKISGTYQIKCPIMLISKNFEEFLDLALENPPLYDYIIKYPSILVSPEKFYKVLVANKVGHLEFDTRFQIKHSKIPNDIPMIDKSNLSSIILKVPSRFKKTDENVPAIQVLRSDKVSNILEQNLVKINGCDLTYNLNGVYVSKFKFIKVWSGIIDELENKPLNQDDNCTLKDLIIYALSFDSYYSKEELDKISNYVKDMEIGEKSYERIK